MPRGQRLWAGQGFSLGGDSAVPRSPGKREHHTSKSRRSRSLFPQDDVDSPGGACPEESGTSFLPFELVCNAEALGESPPSPQLVRTKCH